MVLTTAAQELILLHIGEVGCAQGAFSGPYARARPMSIGLKWAFRLGMRYSPACPHLPRKGNERYERVTPNGPT